MISVPTLPTLSSPFCQGVSKISKSATGGLFSPGGVGGGSGGGGGFGGGSVGGNGGCPVAGVVTVMLSVKGERFSDFRLKQAAETGANELVTACPYCIINFEDSRLSVEGGEAVIIKDITEIIRDVI